MNSRFIYILVVILVLCSIIQSYKRYYRKEHFVSSLPTHTTTPTSTTRQSNQTQKPPPKTTPSQKTTPPQKTTPSQKTTPPNKKKKLKLKSIIKKHLSQYSKSIVKVTVQNIQFNWNKPFSSKSNESIGTGFLIDNEGTIVTCSHVVDEGIKVYVSIPMSGQEKFDATVIGICPDIDVALLSCPSLKNHTYLELGDSDTIKPNDKAIALGYPLGHNKLKFTSGIISGRQDGKLQIDAPINGGNSGGPLLNVDGKVIGINFSKVKTEEAENVGYAIPIKQFINIIEELKSNKITQVPKLGAMFQNMNKDMRRFIQNNKSECKSGFYVRNVVKNGPLYNAGVKTGDILCKFDEIKVDNYGEMSVPWNIEKVHLFDYLKRLKIDKKIKITVWKSDNNIVKTEIMLNNPYNNGVRNFFPRFENVDFVVFGGLVVMKLANNHTTLIKHNNMCKYQNIKHKQDELLIITHVFPGSYVKKLNVLSKGDILKEVNDTPISNLMEYRKALQSVKKVNNESFITIKALDKYYCVLPLAIILNEEPFLAEKHQYKLGKSYNTFMKKLK